MKKLPIAIGLVSGLFAGVIAYKIFFKPQDSRQAWIDILNSCAKSQLIGKDVLYFGASNEIGPGSIWRQNSDGSIRLRYELSDLVPDSAQQKALIHPNNSVSCVQDEFTAADRVIVENAVRIEGFSANFKFSKSIAEGLKGKYTGQSVALQGANLQSQWSNDTTLTMKTPGSFYLLAAFGKLTGAPNKEAFSAPKVGAKAPSLFSERTSALEDMKIRAAAVENIRAAQRLRGAGIDKPPEEVAVIAPTPGAAPKRTFPNVVVTNGMVTLIGAVKDAAAQKQFLMDVQHAPGVRGVNNEIVTKPTAGSGM